MIERTPDIVAWAVSFLLFCGGVGFLTLAATLWTGRRR